MSNIINLDTSDEENPSKRPAASFEEPPKKIQKTTESNAFAEMMKAAKNPPVEAPKPKTFRNFNFENILIPYIENPEKFTKDEVEYYDDDVVVVVDKYPKAKVHYLVMPRRRIDSIHNLKPSDIPTLKFLKHHADKLVAGRKERFRMGFHVVPSLKQLHMHVISQDFHSSALKTKKHWNSFTTDFFKTFDQVVKHLETHGKIEWEKSDYERFLSGPLEPCNQCGKTCKNMPALKEHLASHLS